MKKQQTMEGLWKYPFVFKQGSRMIPSKKDALCVMICVWFIGSHSCLSARFTHSNQEKI